MLYECFSLLIILTSFNITSIFLPYFQTEPNFLDINLKNLTCTDVSGDNVIINVSSERYHFTNRNNITFNCESDLNVHAYHGHLSFTAIVESSNIDLALLSEQPVELYNKNNIFKKSITEQQMTELEHFIHLVQEKRNAKLNSCSSIDSKIVNCEIQLHVTNLTSTPPDPLIELMLVGLKNAIEKNIECYICNVWMQKLQDALKVKTLIPRTNALPLNRNATAVESIKVLQSFTNICNSLKFLINNTNIFVNAALINHTRFSFMINNVEELIIIISSYIRQESIKNEVETHKNYYHFENVVREAWENEAPYTEEEHQMKNLLSRFPQLSLIGNAEVNFLANTHLSFDVDFNDLQCTSEFNECSIPCKDGIQISNFRLFESDCTKIEYEESDAKSSKVINSPNKNFIMWRNKMDEFCINDNDDFQRLFSNHIGPTIMNEINKEMSNYFCSQREKLINIHLRNQFMESENYIVKDANKENVLEHVNIYRRQNKQNEYNVKLATNNYRFVVKMPHFNLPHIFPPKWVIILTISAAIIQSILLICYSVYKNITKRSIVDNITNELISIKRIIVEDSVICCGTSLCLMGFIWSNTTYGATVCIGQEMHMYNFSLVNTVHDFYSAGLYALAIFVLIFSGIYPYVKLYAIVLMTIILEKPESTTLKLIDLFSKYSFIDAFVMIIMVSGLQLKGIADVQIMPSFYIFLMATILSIALGNFATCLWRIDTSLRAENKEMIIFTEFEGVAQNTIIRQSVETEIAVSKLNKVNRAVHTIINEESQITNQNSESHNLLQENNLYIELHDKIKQEMKKYAQVTAAVLRQAITHWDLILIIIGTTVIWIEPCIEFTIEGFVTIITGKTKTVTLMEMNKEAGIVCSIVSIMTITLFPILYAIKGNKFRYLSTWCTVDVFGVASLTAHFQLTKFVTFVLGENMNMFYTAKAKVQ